MARCVRTNYKARGINIPSGAAYWIDAEGQRHQIVARRAKQGQIHFADVPHGAIYLAGSNGVDIKVPYSPSVSRGSKTKRTIPTTTLLTIRRSQGFAALDELVRISTSVHGTHLAGPGEAFDQARDFFAAQGVTKEMVTRLISLGVSDWRQWVALGPRENGPDFTKRLVIANLLHSSSFGPDVRAALADLLFAAPEWWTTAVERQELVIDSPAHLLKEVLRSGRALPESVERLAHAARYARITGEAAEYFATRPTDPTEWLAAHATDPKLRNKLFASANKLVRDAVRTGATS
jgi:hypothetical protein